MSSSLPPPFQLGVPVPSLLWETFEEALRANIRRLAKDIATTLGTPEAPLLNAILKNPSATVRPYLFEEDSTLSGDKEVDMRCGYMCQRPDAPAFLQPCGQPVIWEGATKHHRCAEHLYSCVAPTAKIEGLPHLIPLQTTEGETPLFRSEDGTVYDSHFEPCGYFEKETKTLILFEVESS